MQSLMDTKTYFIRSIGAALHGETAPPLPPDADCARLYRLAVRNTVQGLFCKGLGAELAKFPAELQTKLQKSCQAAAVRESAQQDLLAAIRAQFAEEAIDFMLLKGSHLKALYPAPELRFMVDMDVLVRERDLLRAKEILLGFGLETEFDNGKDIVFIKKPFLTVELHRSLFQENYFMYPYFRAVWNRAQQIGTHEFCMTDSDLYVYTLAHLAEHYTAAGSCFRPVMDLYLLETRRADTLDFAYISAQFQEIGIEKFAENIRALAFCMFDGAQKTETLTMMENFVTLGPPVQNASAASAAAVSQKSKLRRILSAAFPSFRHMSVKYPLLKQLPFLLPIFWAVRLVQYTFTKDKTIVRKKEELQNADRKSADVLARIFKESGL